MTTDTTSFDMSRTLLIAPDRLWQALTDTKERGMWNAPEAGMVMEVDRSDLRVGGEEQHHFGDAAAPDFVINTRWYDLSPAERAVFTETLVIGGEALCTSLVTYVLAADGDATRLNVCVAVSSFSGPETLAEFQQGWDGGLNNLAAHIEAL